MADPAEVTIEPSGFFVLRTPALPFAELSEWASGLSGDSGADLRLLRDRLRDKMLQPHVRDAVFVSSQSLANNIDEWIDSPTSRKGAKVERALVRYLCRMAGRSTPFGLFSGITVGRVGVQTELLLQSCSHYRRLTRIDADYLFRLCHRLGTDRQIRNSLRYRPNQTLVWRGDSLRYIEATVKGVALSHQLVSVAASSHISSALNLAMNGATVPELTAAVMDQHADEDLSAEEVLAFLDELIDAQLLVSDLFPLVTGDAASEEIASQLDQIASASPVANTLRKIEELFASIDAEGLGASPDKYRSVQVAFRELPLESDSDHLFQVDMLKPATTATLGPDVVDLFVQGIRALSQIAAPAKLTGIQEFCTAFTERYGEQELPLLEVLDEEDGIGFNNTASVRTPEPLLAGLPFVSPVDPPKLSRSWSQRESYLLGQLEELMRDGRAELSLTESDLNHLRNPDPNPLPEAFCASGVLVGPAEAGGPERLLFKGASGPCGTRMFGRFCYADEELHQVVKAHQQVENERSPEVIFAEIVHQPSYVRLGNVVSRPVLREYEIPYWGRSGASQERQIPVSDLLVSVKNNEIELRSERLGKRVIPRMTNAHNYTRNSPGIYRFLCTLVNQGVALGIGWNWGALESCRFLPRVVVGNVILSRARWALTRDDIRAFPPSGDRSLVQKWRDNNRLPRFVELHEGDNELPIDLDNPLCASAFGSALKHQGSARLTELLPLALNRCVKGPEGIFTNEIQIPFIASRFKEPKGKESSRRPSISRSFTPGSEWLYVKLYSGPSVADVLLTELVSPLVAQAAAQGEIDQWFFIRYNDPDPHIRVRLHGEPNILTGELLQRLHLRLNGPSAPQGIWKTQLDTYEREVERYGGDGGIVLAEQIFFHDSKAALGCILAERQGQTPFSRWQVAALGVDWLLDDFALDHGEKLQLTAQCRDAFGKEFGVKGGFRHALSNKYRSMRAQLQQVLRLKTEESADPIAATFRLRSAELSPVIKSLSQAAARGKLSRSLQDILVACIHMQVNRLIASSSRAQEFVLYEFLYRHYESERARGTRTPKGAA